MLLISGHSEFETGLFLFAENLNASRDEVEGNIEWARCSGKNASYTTIQIASFFFYRPALREHFHGPVLSIRVSSDETI